MNGLSKIEQRLREESKAALDALSAQTEETLREIRREYEDRAERERQEAEKKQTAAAEERLERLRSAARMETEKMLLAAKQEIMEEAFGMALKKLCTLPQEQYAAFLKKLLREAVSTGRETVIFNHKDKSELGARLVGEVNAELGAHLTLSEKDGAMQAGFLLSDGECEINCDFAVLLSSRREELERETASRLFPS